MPHNRQSNRVIDMAPYFEELVQRDTIRAVLGLAEVSIVRLWWIEAPDHRVSVPAACDLDKGYRITYKGLRPITAWDITYRQRMIGKMVYNVT